MKYFIILPLLMLFLTSISCSSAKINAIKSPAKENQSTITVFRPDAFAAGGNDMIVSINNNDIAVLRDNQYTSVLVPSGEHTVSVRGTIGLSSEIIVQTKQNETLLFEAAGSANNWMNFVLGSVLVKANFYIEKANQFDRSKFNKVAVRYQ